VQAYFRGLGAPPAVKFGTGFAASAARWLLSVRVIIDHCVDYGELDQSPEKSNAPDAAVVLRARQRTTFRIAGRVVSFIDMNFFPSIFVARRWGTKKAQEQEFFVAALIGAFYKIKGPPRSIKKDVRCT